MAAPILHSSRGPLRVSLVAIPDAVVSTLSGIYDAMNAFRTMLGRENGSATALPFEVEVVGEAEGPLTLASGVPFSVECAIERVTSTDRHRAVDPAAVRRLAARTLRAAR
jgi:hypothetical protein